MLSIYCSQSTLLEACDAVVPALYLPTPYIPLVCLTHFQPKRINRDLTRNHYYYHTFVSEFPNISIIVIEMFALLEDTPPHEDDLPLT